MKTDNLQSERKYLQTIHSTKIFILVYFSPITHYLDYRSFKVSLEVSSQFSNFIFSFNVVLAVLSLLPLPIHFRISLLISTKYLAWVSIEIALTLYNSFGRTDILKTLIYILYEHEASLHLFSFSLVSFIRFCSVLKK